jgi:hypothetical protein
MGLVFSLSRGSWCHFSTSDGHRRTKSRTESAFRLHRRLARPDDPSSPRNASTTASFSVPQWRDRLRVSFSDDVPPPPPPPDLPRVEAAPWMGPPPGWMGGWVPWRIVLTRGESHVLSDVAAFPTGV